MQAVLSLMLKECHQVVPDKAAEEPVVHSAWGVEQEVPVKVKDI